MNPTGPARGADPRLAALGDLRDALRDLLTQLEDPAADREPLLGGRGRCQECLERYERAEAELPRAQGELARELDAALEEALRLNAVATSLAQRQVQQVAGALGEVRRVRRDLAAGPIRRGTGGSCDVSG